MTSYRCGDSQVIDRVVQRSCSDGYSTSVAEGLKVIITQTTPNTPFLLPGTTMPVAFDPLPFPPLPPTPPPGWPWMRSLAPTITQPQGPNYFQLDYLLPASTRIGDQLECFLIDVNFPFPMLFAKFLLDDLSVFLALRRYRGIYTRGEISVQTLVASGITAGTHDFQIVQSRIPSPTPAAPFPPGPQTPLSTVAVSFVNTYVIT